MKIILLNKMCIMNVSMFQVSSSCICHSFCFFCNNPKSKSKIPAALLAAGPWPLFGHTPTLIWEFTEVPVHVKTNNNKSPFISTSVLSSALLNSLSCLCSEIKAFCRWATWGRICSRSPDRRDILISIACSLGHQRRHSSETVQYLIKWLLLYTFVHLRTQSPATPFIQDPN